MPAYIGVNGKAKAIAKVYKGNSEGKAEMIWGPKGPCRYSKAVAGLSTPRYSLSGSEIGDYALFAGGLMQSSSTSSTLLSKTVDVYDKTLTRRTLIDLYSKRSGMVSGKNENYAIFACGNDEYDAKEYSDYPKTVYAYDKSLTCNTREKMYYVRKSPAVCGGIALSHVFIAGGINKKGGDYSSFIEGFEATTLRHDTLPALSEKKSNLVGVPSGSSSSAHYLFAGGYTGSNYVSTVEAYGPDLNKLNNAAALSAAKGGCSATSIGDYGIIAGGGGLSCSNTVDAYSSNLVKTTPAPLTSTSTNMVATTLRDEYALFCGFSNSKYSIDAYDKNLTKVSVKFGTARTLLSAASVGDYALFAGGVFNSVSQYTVDAFYIFE